MSTRIINTDPEVLAEIDAAEQAYVNALELRANKQVAALEQVRDRSHKRALAAAERRKEAALERRLRGPGWN